MKLAIALVALAGCGTPTKPTEAPARISALDGIAERAIEDGGAVGISIVVMRGDRVVHARGYGFADVEQRVSTTEHSVYLLASRSKQFWGVGIAQLVEQNRLSVESPIVDVLHNFPDRRVKVKHLLTQSSGLGEDSDDEDDVRFSDAPKSRSSPGRGGSTPIAARSSRGGSSNRSRARRGATICRRISRSRSASPR